MEMTRIAGEDMKMTGLVYEDLVKVGQDEKVYPCCRDDDFVGCILANATKGDKIRILIKGTARL